MEKSLFRTVVSAVALSLLSLPQVNAQVKLIAIGSLTESSAGPNTDLSGLVGQIDPDKSSGREFVDPEHAEKLGDGDLRAPRLLWQDALRLYGGGLHH